MKKIISIMLAITILFSISTIVFASFDISTDNYDPGGLTGYTNAYQKGSKIVSAIQIVGIVIAVVGIIAIGIKYLVASVEERANYKKTLIPYLIGFIMIIAIVTILKIIADLTQGAMG